MSQPPAFAEWASYPESLLADELTVDGKLYPWYLAPIHVKEGEQFGLFVPPEQQKESFDPFEEHRVIFDHWADFSETGPVLAFTYTNQDGELCNGTSEQAFDILCALNPGFCIHKVLKIVTKAKKLERFDHWKVGQRLLYWAFCLQWFQGKPTRIIELKARQVGGSTWSEALMFWITAYHDYQSAIVITDKREHSANMLGMLETFYASCFDTLLAAKIPQRQSHTTSSLIFDTPRKAQAAAQRKKRRRKEGDGEDVLPSEGPVRHSAYHVRTAAAVKASSGKGAERSGTRSAVHGSEVDFWPNPERGWLGLASEVPDTGGTFVMLESTANGYGGFMHERWSDAFKPGSKYLPVFVSWLTAPFQFSNGKWIREYSEDLPEAFAESRSAFVATYDEEEEGLAKKGATSEQIQWRRTVLRDKCSGDPLLFRQEYPATPEEAFISTGQPVYAPEATQFYIDQTKFLDGNEVLWQGEFQITEDNKVLQMKRHDGSVRIWKWAEPGKTYCVGVDPSEGRSEFADESWAVVWCAEDLEEVAVCRCVEKEIDFVALQARALQLEYSHAMIVPEANAVGAALVTHLTAYDADPLYIRDMPDHRSGNLRQAIGYYAAGGSKRRAVAEAKSMFNGDRDEKTGAPRFKLRFHNLGTVLQFQHLIYRNSKFASSSKRIGDDGHDATVICWMGMNSPQFVRRADERPKTKHPNQTFQYSPLQRMGSSEAPVHPVLGGY